MRKRVLVAIAISLYFSQGFPYGIVNELLPLYLRKQGVSLGQIGLLSTVSLAWTWKVLWSPLVDIYGTYRRWITGALVFITIALGSLAFIPPQQSLAFWTLVALLAFASATQDIAIDAMTIRITPTDMLGHVNSIRVSAYRGAMILAGGGLAAASQIVGWRGAFMIAAAATTAIMFATRVLPEERGARTMERANPFHGLSQWFQRPRAPLLLALVLLYRLGDSALTPMTKPYWVDRGYSTAEIGTVTTVIGISFLILGAIAGGVFLARFGIYAGLLWLGILQMLSNVGYALAAQTDASRPALYAVAIIENFTGGLGTAAFLAFLMSICDTQLAATQYALFTAVFGLSRSLIGTFSGLTAQRLGYTQYFWLTVALGVPGLLLLAALRGTITGPPPSTAELLAEA